MIPVGYDHNEMGRAGPAELTRATIPQSWRDACSAEIKRRGWSDAELARRVGCGPEDIHYLLRSKKQPRGSSKWARPVADELKVPLPHEPTLPQRELDWLDLGRQLFLYSPSKFEKFAAALREKLSAWHMEDETDQRLKSALERDRSDRDDTL